MTTLVQFDDWLPKIGYPWHCFADGRFSVESAAVGLISRPTAWSIGLSYRGGVTRPALPRVPKVEISVTTDFSRFAREPSSRQPSDLKAYCPPCVYKQLMSSPSLSVRCSEIAEFGGYA